MVCFNAGRLDSLALVDASVWTDYIRGVIIPQSEKLDTLLRVEQLFTSYLMLTEVLQGFVSRRGFNQARKLLASMPLIPRRQRRWVR